MDELFKFLNTLAENPTVGVLFLVFYGTPMVFVGFMFWVATKRIESPLQLIADRISLIEGYLLGTDSRHIRDILRLKTESHHG